MVSLPLAVTLTLKQQEPHNEKEHNMISLTGAVTIVIYLIVAGLIFGLLWWLVDYCGIPEPFHKAAKVGLAILAVLVIIGLLLSLVTGTPIFRP